MEGEEVACYGIIALALCDKAAESHILEHGQRETWVDWAWTSHNSTGRAQTFCITSSTARSRPQGGSRYCAYSTVCCGSKQVYATHHQAQMHLELITMIHC